MIKRQDGYSISEEELEEVRAHGNWIKITPDFQVCIVRGVVYTKDVKEKSA